MRNIIASLVLLLLVGCATNQQPAEIVGPTKPSKTQPPTKSTYYLVKAGDTYTSIAKRFGLSREDLLKFNKIKSDAPIVPGQRLLIKARPGNQPEQQLSDGITAKPLDDISSQSPIDSSVSSATEEIGASTETLIAPSSESSAITSNTSSGYRAPLSGKIIKEYGKLPDGSFNKGINIAAPKGVPVKAISDGVVKYAGSQAAEYGKLVMIQHGDGKISTYAHLNTIDVKTKAVVSAGSKIGTVGSTGNVSQPQLHLQIRGSDKTPIDPHTLISGLG